MRADFNFGSFYSELIEGKTHITFKNYNTNILLRGLSDKEANEELPIIDVSKGHGYRNGKTVDKVYRDNVKNASHEEILRRLDLIDIKKIKDNLNTLFGDFFERYEIEKETEDNLKKLMSKEPPIEGEYIYEVLLKISLDVFDIENFKELFLFDTESGVQTEQFANEIRHDNFGQGDLFKDPDYVGKYTCYFYSMNTTKKSKEKDTLKQFDLILEDNGIAEIKYGALQYKGVAVKKRDTIRIYTETASNGTESSRFCELFFVYQSYNKVVIDTSKPRTRMFIRKGFFIYDEVEKGCPVMAQIVIFRESARCNIKSTPNLDNTWFRTLIESLLKVHYRDVFVKKDRVLEVMNNYPILKSPNFEHRFKMDEGDLCRIKYSSLIQDIYNDIGQGQVFEYKGEEREKQYTDAMEGLMRIVEQSSLPTRIPLTAESALYLGRRYEEKRNRMDKDHPCGEGEDLKEDE